MHTISIEPFEAEYKTKIMGGKDRWSPCQVIGVSVDGVHGSQSRFITIVEDEDGNLWPDTAELVRRTE
ncbi:MULTISPECIES: hypothetical protein [unclassified Mesorhizobium]|uniref:hypothetical protein n=1 Tax=unclassified Mesorhizobium TaxID=325217 RepID=UPI000FCA41C8|nr:MULTISPECIES: hypothetical protein [unclassified Mesorhizobium]RUW71027.1 hypothetical protein EOA31_18915 [Mesorhizobium sp. M4B.F.Ca.ET.049.02.1.2]RVD70780.1 hypothetical protein EN751_18915 [Mesorhizobium sp. M4A.F.Ca.ET.029.04.2.1]TGV26443.1 hypothetical protein EN786_13090 [Mesorhizobium sp. M4B.F.Ca.ET.143.01.1.1]TIW36533.1 MAG: hypothetical protein E5V62_06135 [Mesorhizobium sp.]